MIIGDTQKLHLHMYDDYSRTQSQNNFLIEMHLYDIVEKAKVSSTDLKCAGQGGPIGEQQRGDPSHQWPYSE